MQVASPKTSRRESSSCRLSKPELFYVALHKLAAVLFSVLPALRMLLQLQLHRLDQQVFMRPFSQHRLDSARVHF